MEVSAPWTSHTGSTSAGIVPAFHIAQNPSSSAPELIVLPAPTSPGATALKLFIEFALAEQLTRLESKSNQQLFWERDP